MKVSWKCSCDENHKMLWVHTLHFKVKPAKKSLTLTQHGSLCSFIRQYIKKTTTTRCRLSVDSVFFLDEYWSEEMRLVRTKLLCHFGSHPSWCIFSDFWIFSCSCHDFTRRPRPRLMHSTDIHLFSWGRCSNGSWTISWCWMMICSRSVDELSKTQRNSNTRDFLEHVVLFQVHSADPTFYSVFWTPASFWQWAQISNWVSSKRHHQAYLWVFECWSFYLLSCPYSGSKLLITNYGDLLNELWAH